MKVIFFGPESSAALHLLGEISPDYSPVRLEDKEELLAQLESGELTVVLMDYDDPQQGSLSELILEKYPQVKRILTSAERSTTDFRQHQLGEQAADGYLRAPLDAGLLEEILNSFQMAFTADQPEQAASDRGGTIDIVVTPGQEEAAVETTQGVAEETSEETPAEDDQAPPPLDPAKMKIIEQTLAKHHINADEEEGPPPFDNTLNRKIQGVFDSVFKKSSGGLDLAQEDSLEIESKKAVPIANPEEIEFSLQNGGEEQETQQHGVAASPEAKATPPAEEGTGVDLEVADGSLPALELGEASAAVAVEHNDAPEEQAGGIPLDLSNEGDHEENMEKSKPAAAAAVEEENEDDKQTIQFDLAQMKKELQMDTPPARDQAGQGGVDLEFATGQLQEEKKAEDPAAVSSESSGLDLSLGNAGTGLVLEGQAENSAVTAEVPQEPTKATKVNELNVGLNESAEAPAADELNLDFNASSPEEAPAPTPPSPDESSLQFSAGEEIGETTGDVPIPDSAAQGEFDPAQTASRQTSPSIQNLSFESAGTNPGTVTITTPGSLQGQGKTQVTQTQVAEFSLNAGPSQAPAPMSAQDRPQQVVEYRAYLDHKKEHDVILSHHGNELVRLSATIRNLREDRENLLRKISRLEEEKVNLTQDGLNARAELDELKIENAIIRKRHQEEKEILQYEAQMMGEKKLYYEEKIRHLQEQLGKVEHKVKLDINKILAREKELEGKIELMRSDAESQLKSREDKIIELKKKIDLLEFDMENMTSYEKKFKESNLALEERLGRVMKTLRVAMKMLDDEPVSTDNVGHLRKAK